MFRSNSKKVGYSVHFHQNLDQARLHLNNHNCIHRLHHQPQRQMVAVTRPLLQNHPITPQI